VRAQADPLAHLQARTAQLAGQAQLGYPRHPGRSGRDPCRCSISASGADQRCDLIGSDRAGLSTAPPRRRPGDDGWQWVV
jgi:hypothetical protein